VARSFARWMFHRTVGRHPHPPAGRTQLVQAVKDLGRACLYGRDVGAVCAPQLRGRH
jgi:hypothetical protein